MITLDRVLHSKIPILPNYITCVLFLGSSIRSTIYYYSPQNWKKLEKIKQSTTVHKKQTNHTIVHIRKRGQPFLQQSSVQCYRNKVVDQSHLYKIFARLWTERKSSQ